MPEISMELDLLGLLGSAGDMHGSGTHYHARAAVRHDKMAALMSAARRDDELRRPRVVGAAGSNTQPSSFRDHHQLLQGFMQVPPPRLPQNDDHHASPPQDARCVLLAASDARGENGLAATPTAVAGLAFQRPHHSAATTIERSCTAATDHATARVTVSCAGATRVLDNVPREMVEQFVLSVAKATGPAATPPVPEAEPQPQPAASPSKTETHMMMKLLGAAHGQDSDLQTITRKKASLARFLHKRTQRAETIAPYPRREIPTASARNKVLISGIQKNRNEYFDDDALLTELKI